MVTSPLRDTIESAVFLTIIGVTMAVLCVMSAIVAWRYPLRAAPVIMFTISMLALYRWREPPDGIDPHEWP